METTEKCADRGPDSSITGATHCTLPPDHRGPHQERWVDRNGRDRVWMQWDGDRS